MKGSRSSTTRSRLASKARRRRRVWRLTGAVLLVATALGAVVVLFPVRIFGISRRSVEYSLERHISGHAISADCVRRPSSRWRCDLFDGQSSMTTAYSVVVSEKGCWTATSIGVKPTHGCLEIWDYVRVFDW